MGKWLGNIWGKSQKIMVILVRSVYTHSSRHRLSISCDELLSTLGYREVTFLMGNLYPALGRLGEGRELFLHLLFLNCLQLKIICLPKCHILGWHILIPFKILGHFQKKEFVDLF